MKKVLITIFCMAIFFTNNAQTNKRAELNALLKNRGYSISKELYADLKKGETAHHWKTFTGGLNYAIIAYSEDSEVYDIDIYLYDSDGKSILVKDQKTDSFAIVEYLPLVTRKMKVVIKNHNSKRSYREYKCKFLIAYY